MPRNRSMDPKKPWPKSGRRRTGRRALGRRVPTLGRERPKVGREDVRPPKPRPPKPRPSRASLAVVEREPACGVVEVDCAAAGTAGRARSRRTIRTTRIRFTRRDYPPPGGRDAPVRGVTRAGDVVDRAAPSAERAL